MKTYVYGYDIRIVDYEDEFRTIKSGDRNVLVVHEMLSEEDAVYLILRRICTASLCRHSKPLAERIEEARRMFEIKNVKLVREYGG